MESKRGFVGREEENQTHAQIRDVGSHCGQLQAMEVVHLIKHGKGETGQFTERKGVRKHG